MQRVRMLAVLVLFTFFLPSLPGCSKNAEVTKAEEDAFKHAPKEIPADAQKMIQEKMKESQEKMRQSTPGQTKP